MILRVRSKLSFQAFSMTRTIHEMFVTQIFKTYDELAALGMIKERSHKEEYKRVNAFQYLVQSGKTGFFKQIMIFNKKYVKGSTAED